MAKAQMDILKKIGLGREPQSRQLIQSINLEETEPPALLTSMVFVIGCLVFFGFVWAGVTRVDEVARAEGKIIPESDVQAIQHYEGGIVSEILVKEGEVVNKGQALLRLAKIDARAQLDRMKARQISVLLERERQNALAWERTPDFEKVIEAVDGLSVMQDAGVETHRETYLRQHDLLNNQLGRQQAEYQRLNNKIPSLTAELKLLRQELDRRQSLFDKGLTTQSALLDAKRQESRVASSLKETQDQLVGVEAASAEIRSGSKSRALSRVNELDLELTEIVENIKMLDDRNQRLELNAPVKGIVQNLAINAINAVVQPGQTLLEIVPVDEQLLVEVRVDPKDIGHLNPGQDVDLKISTYDYALYGSVPGKLLRVSATTFQTREGTQYYQAVVAPERAYVGNDPVRNILLPGMVVQASINIGQKSILDYLLKPVYRGFSEAFRER